MKKETREESIARENATEARLQKEFPKLAIKESGRFEGKEITRISAKLYEVEGGRMSYTKADLIRIENPRVIRTGRGGIC